jgi:hypothetical protein
MVAPLVRRLEVKMQVGDVVIPVGGTVLACGCGRYDCAIVASIEPFALASVDADMLWTCMIQPGDVLALCQAAPDIVARAVQRYESHTSNKGATFGAGGDVR